jgi:hypothetical protein
MNLVRLGHYFTPTGNMDAALDFPDGTCRTALVIDVEAEDLVSLAVWNPNGGQEHRTGVRVSAPAFGDDTFHLSGDCPWKR